MSDQKSILPLELQQAIFVPLILISNLSWIPVWFILFGRYRGYDFIRKRSVSALIIFNYGMFAFENSVLLGWRLFEDYSGKYVPTILIDFFGLTGVVSWGFGYLMLCLQYNILRLQSKIQLYTGRYTLSSSTTSKASNSTNSTLATLSLSWGEIFLLRLYEILEFKNLDTFSGVGQPNLNNLKAKLCVLRQATVFKYGLLIFICGIIFMILSHFFWASNLDLIKEGISFPIRLLSVSLGCVVEGCVLIMVFVMRSFRDSLGFVQELRASFVGLSVPTIAFIILTYFLGETEFSSKYGSNTVLMPLLLYDRFLMLFYIYKCYHSQKMVDSSSPLSHLMKIIQDEESFARLKLSMADDLCLENALYIQDVIDAHKECRMPLTLPGYHEHLQVSSKTLRLKVRESAETSRYSIASTDQLQKKWIKDIYNKFVKSESPYELNISSDQRIEIANLLKEDKDCDLGCLNSITNDVLKMILQNNFTKFMCKEAHINT